MPEADDPAEVSAAAPAREVGDVIRPPERLTVANVYVYVCKRLMLATVVGTAALIGYHLAI